MKLRLFKLLIKVHFLAKPIYCIAALSLIATIALPVFYPQLDTLYWFAALSASAFLFSSAAVIDIAHHHGQPRSGVSGWFSELWNKLMFWGWLVATGFLVLFLIKILGYMYTH